MHLMRSMLGHRLAARVYVVAGCQPVTTLKFDKLEAYPTIFLGRPRGRRVDSSLNLVAVRWTHGASP
jgi:hypothetical protein